jgi:glutamate synthase domain-containing protein 2
MEKNPENVEEGDYEVGLGETALLWRAPNPETGNAGFNYRNVARELREQHKASWNAKGVNSTKKRGINNNRSVFSKKLKLVNERKTRKNRK